MHVWPIGTYACENCKGTTEEWYNTNWRDVTCTHLQLTSWNRWGPHMYYRTNNILSGPFLLDLLNVTIREYKVRRKGAESWFDYSK